jgi:peptidyl-tRNA hydrolase, PTH1 family
MWRLMKNLLLRRAPARPEDAFVPGAQWILVPLGNPGDDYAATRHNLGRLLLQRWMDAHRREAGPLKPGRIHAFKTGNLYALGDPFLALVPGTYMNLSGQTCAEAVAAGFDPKRLILLHDDKDLPLGLGRFRLTGGSAGHNGMTSVFEKLGTQDLARLRLGIGPYQRPLHEFVLGEWTDEEWRLIDGLDGPFARFLELLATAESLERLPGLTNAEAFWAPVPPAIPLEPEGLS